MRRIDFAITLCPECGERKLRKRSCTGRLETPSRYQARATCGRRECADAAALKAKAALWTALRADRPAPAVRPTWDEAMQDTLIAIRMQAGLSQGTLSMACGVGDRSISSYESGSRLRSLKVAQLYAICRACGVDLETFFRVVNAATRQARDFHTINSFSARPQP